MQNPFNFGIKTGSHPTTKMSPVVSLLDELVLFNSNKIHVKHANKFNKFDQSFDFPMKQIIIGKIILEIDLLCYGSKYLVKILLYKNVHLLSTFKNQTSKMTGGRFSPVSSTNTDHHDYN